MKAPLTIEGTDHEKDGRRWDEMMETSGDDGDPLAATGRRVAESALRARKSLLSMASARLSPLASSAFENQDRECALKSPTTIASPSG